MEHVTFFPFTSNATIPTRGSAHSAGLDLSCAEERIIPAGRCGVVTTDLGVELPLGTYGWVTSRSGLAAKGIVVQGGIIDSDYRGDIRIILYNQTDTDFVVRKYDRVAQMIVQSFKFPLAIFSADPKEMGKTQRGTNGFGSTGLQEARKVQTEPDIEDSGCVSCGC